MKDLAFVYVRRSSFVADDVDILQRRFDLVEVAWDGKRAVPRLAWAVARARASFSWFAADHAYGAARMGALLGRPSMVVIGGPDASWVPEIGQGAFGDPAQARRITATCRLAAGVFPVDASLARDLLANTGLPGQNVRTIPTGYDASHWLPGPKEPGLVLTVGDVNAQNLLRKGLATFAKAARLVPEARFVIVGGFQDAVGERLRREAPANLTLMGRVEGPELRRWYQRAQVYCQLSRHEGLPNALCEAMLCGCVPVGTPHYGIPGAIGDTGLLVPWNDASAAAQAVRQALRMDTGARARARIAALFPKERRVRELAAAVEAVLERKPLPDFPEPAVDSHFHSKAS
jgi:glycosyltransferase involved in cell wall biosynthesis